MDSVKKLRKRKAKTISYKIHRSLCIGLNANKLSNFAILYTRDFTLNFSERKNILLEFQK